MRNTGEHCWYWRGQPVHILSIHDGVATFVVAGYQASNTAPESELECISLQRARDLRVGLDPTRRKGDSDLEGEPTKAPPVGPREAAGRVPESELEEAFVSGASWAESLYHANARPSGFIQSARVEFQARVANNPDYFAARSAAPSVPDAEDALSLRSLLLTDSPLSDEQRAALGRVILHNESQRRAAPSVTPEGERLFPIMGERVATRLPGIPWSVIAPHDDYAQHNHGGQTLEVLASRGGLSPSEALHVLLRTSFYGQSATADHARITALSFAEQYAELQKLVTARLSARASGTGEEK